MIKEILVEILIHVMIQSILYKIFSKIIFNRKKDKTPFFPAKKLIISLYIFWSFKEIFQSMLTFFNPNLSKDLLSKKILLFSSLEIVKRKIQKNIDSNFQILNLLLQLTHLVLL